MNRILLVDDDENILHGYKRNMRAKFDVTTSNSPLEALKILKQENEFAVIISDFSMPGMNGIEFLKKASEISKDSVRILLTGNANLQMAIEAVNKGNIFRFLTKPCPIETLLNTMRQAAEQYWLIQSEKLLLNKTLTGVVKVLTDILITVNPLSFNYANRLTNLAKRIISRINLDFNWEIQIGCLLSQIGHVGIPQNIVEKRLHNLSLNSEENELFYSHTALGEKLLSSIPRMEDIAQGIKYQYSEYSGNEYEEEVILGDNIPLLGRLLKVLNDYFLLQIEGKSDKEILEIMFANFRWYDSEILNGLAAELKGAKPGLIQTERKIEDLHPGLVIAENFYDSNHILLVPANTELNEILIIKLKSYKKVHRIENHIKVFEKK